MRIMRPVALGFVVLAFAVVGRATAGVGDVQLRTDHPWYPGELACSTFERLFATQAELYERVTGIRPTTDEHKVLAAWLWRNTHYWHGEEGVEDLWSAGFNRGGDTRTRDYWTGLFAHGFGLCGTTHSQWTAEMEALLGHGRGRCIGVDDHNTFEVLLKGDRYGAGRWALLDHDISTVVFDAKGEALLSLLDVHKDWQRLTSQAYLPERQPWLVCGLFAEDGVSYRRLKFAEYLAGYSGPPPMVALRSGESLRRYFQPGLEDGRTFVFWGKNYASGGIPGPERSLTWVNQPDKMYKAKKPVERRTGQARFANAVYTYRPDFATTAYREGVIDESERHVTFEFYTPYIIGATPATDSAWGIYEPGCRNGLVLRGKGGAVPVSVSTDQGATWHDAGPFNDGLDLTDHVKGRRQYFLRFGAGAGALRDLNLTMVTVCQANASVFPRLKDNGTKVTFRASGRALVSAGPNLAQAMRHVVAGALGSPKVALQIASPRQEPALALHAAAHIMSGNPPRPDVRYRIEYSADDGATWQPLVDDWKIARQGPEPVDFWSQSLCWGSIELKGAKASSYRVRFSNSAGHVYARAEAHLVYRAPGADAVKVTYAWSDAAGKREESHLFPAADVDSRPWQIPTGANTQTRWVELQATRAR
jgi:hypothetical protein